MVRYYGAENNEDLCNMMGSNREMEQLLGSSALLMNMQRVSGKSRELPVPVQSAETLECQKGKFHFITTSPQN